MANEDRKKREQGILSDLKRGLAEGFRITPEDRRDLLWEVRDAEGKSEPPRGTQVFGTHTLTDVARQAKTVDPKAFGWLPVDAINNETFIRRANTGMNFGPSPQELLGGEVTAANLNAYKQALHNQSRARKGAFLGGSLASDVVQDSSRSIWWLLNAAQATGNVINEQLSAIANPDLFANRVVPLAEAKEKGWVAFKEPVLDAEVFQARVQKIRELNKQELEASLADGHFDESQEKEIAAALDTDVSKRARAELLEEAKAQPVNYKNTRPGVKVRSNRILKRRFNPNLVTAATLIPAGIGINAGIGLLGRNEGYAMTVPKEDDPFSTDNVVAEVAAKYLAGREGRLLEAEDFLLARPDVTYGEYQNYKGYLRDRDLDLNPFDDGKINAGGLLKTNPDGIRGPEVSFMGKTLPVNDTLLGVGGSILGGSLGAALTNLGSIRLRGGVKARKGLGKLGAYMPEVLPRQRDGSRTQAHPGNQFINDMQSEFDKDDGWKHNARVLGTVFGGGMGGLAIGELTGNNIEDERRRRNFAENNPGVDYDQVKLNSQQLLKDKYDVMRATPDAAEQREKSRTGFNKRSQQQSLNTEMLHQQTLVDQLVSEERRELGQKSLDVQRDKAIEFAAIENEIGKRRKKKKEEEPMLPATVYF